MQTYETQHAMPLTSFSIGDLLILVIIFALNYLFLYYFLRSALEVRDDVFQRKELIRQNNEIIELLRHIKNGTK